VLSPVPVINLALHDDGNLARLFLSSIDQSFDQSMIQSPITQVSTARNFPALSLTRPERILRAMPSSSLAPPSSKSHNSPATLERPNGPATTLRLVAAAATSAQTKMVKHARLHTASQEKIVWLPSIRLAC
jgi:hypothetical protein